MLSINKIEEVQPVEEKVFPTPEDQVKRFPVRLLYGYCPKDPSHPKHPTTGRPQKVERGTVISLPISEAREVIGKGIGERADEIPID